MSRDEFQKFVAGDIQVALTYNFLLHIFEFFLCYDSII